jgi:hypothetical protein
MSLSLEENWETIAQALDDAFLHFLRNGSHFQSDNQEIVKSLYRKKEEESQHSLRKDRGKEIQRAEEGF